MFSSAILKLKEGGQPEGEKEGQWYYISSFEESDDSSQTVELKDLYVQRGTIYRLLNIDVLSCYDFKQACDLGECQDFNANCKK